MGRSVFVSLLTLLGSSAVAVTSRPAFADDCEHSSGALSACPAYRLPMIFSLDVSAVAAHVDISERAAAEGMVAPGPRAARGGSFRFLTGLYGVYAGGELAALSLEPPTQMVVSRSSEQPDPSAGGAAIELRLIVGTIHSHGRVLVGAELGLGLRDVFRDAAASAEERSSAQGLLDLRATGGVWLTRHISLSLQLGASLVRDEQSTALLLGFAALPWNSTR